MTYFACNSADSRRLVDKLVAVFTQDSPASHWIALVDKAFDHQSSALRWHGETTSLYQTGRLANLEHASPTLYALPTSDTHTLHQELLRLVRHASGRPMLSFLKSSLTAQQLASKFQGVLELQTTDGQVFALRLADTRSLPAVAESFSAENWSRVTQGIDRWVIVNRAADPEDLALPQTEDVSEHSVDLIVLLDDELDQLVALNQPDALAQALFDNFPDLMPKKEHAAFYQTMAQVCDMGAKHQIEAFPDLMSLAVATVSTEGQILQNPKLGPWLDAKAWAQGQFASELVQFMEDV
jgi:hypothetical protein